MNRPNRVRWMPVSALLLRKINNWSILTPESRQREESP